MQPSYQMEGDMSMVPGLGTPYGQGMQYDQVMAAMPYGQGTGPWQQEQQEQPKPKPLKPKKGGDRMEGLPWQSDAERKAERRELRAKLEVHRQKEINMDNEGTIKWLCSLAIINAFLLCIPIFGNCWLFKPFVGIGIKTMTIRTGLFFIDVNVKCGKNWLEDKFCKGVVKKMSGSHSLQEATHIACAVNAAVPGGNACDIVHRIYTSSFVIIGSFSLAIICNLCGAVFLSHYWYSSPLPQVRMWAFFFFCAAPLLAISGIGFWAIFTPSLEELPRAWTAQASAIVGNDLFAIKPGPGIPYGWSSIFAVGVMVFLFAQVMLYVSWFVPHEMEEEEMLKQEQKRDELEQRILDMQSENMPDFAVQQAAPTYPTQQWYPEQQQQQQQPVAGIGFH